MSVSNWPPAGFIICPECKGRGAICRTPAYLDHRIWMKCPSCGDTGIVPASVQSLEEPRESRNGAQGEE